MSNQDIVDEVEDALPPHLPADIKGKILDAIWNVLNDSLGVDLRVKS